MVVQHAADSTELPKTFTFDNVFDWTSTQSEVYEETAKPIVESVLEGYNGTVFAYGQTGTGKTHTMDGGASDNGIIPRTFNQIFEAIQVPDKLTTGLRLYPILPAATVVTNCSRLAHAVSLSTMGV